MSLADRNPLRCGGTDLPIPLLVMAKAMAICLVSYFPPAALPSPFLPFLPPLDWLEQALPGAVRLTLATLYAGSVAALLCNVRARAASFTLGATILLAMLGDRTFFSNNKTFLAFMLLLAGLYHARFGTRLLRLQVVTVYFGAALHKMLDPDWQSGVFFDAWFGTGGYDSLYPRIASMLPPLALGKALCWGTIALEFALAGMFLVRPWWPAAIWSSLVFHSAITVFTGDRFYFFYAIQPAMLAFVEWPRRLLVIYDGDCGLCNRIREWWQRFDFDRLFQWQPLQSGAGGQFSTARLKESLHLVSGSAATSGFRACKRMLQYHPATWLALAALIAMPRLAHLAAYRAAVIVAALAFFVPFTEPAGEMVYRWVARNRQRFSGRGCTVDAIEPK